MIYDEDPFRRSPRKSTARQKTTGEVRLDGGNLGRMGFRTRPTHQNRAIGRLRRENYYNAVQFGYDRHESEGYLGYVGLTCSLKPCRPRAAGRIFLFTMLPVVFAYFAPAYAHPVTEEIHYTRYKGEPNVKKVTVHFDGQNLTFGQPEPLASVNGADGIAFTPDGDLIIGGQGDRVHRLRPDGSGLHRTVTTGGGLSFHVTVDPDGRRVWTSGMPGALAEIPLDPFRDGHLHELSGDDDAITGIAFDDTGRAFYTASDYRGGGSFGVLDLTTMKTRRLMDGLESAHGIAFDPYSGELILFGGDQLVQIDPARPGEIKDSRRFRLEGRFDQGAPDGRGHLFVARTSGHIVFVDYAETRQIGHPDNKVSVAYLDSYLDDIAPLVIAFDPPERAADDPGTNSPDREKVPPSSREKASPPEEKSGAKGAGSSRVVTPPGEMAPPPAAGGVEEGTAQAKEGSAPSSGNEAAPPEGAGSTRGAEPDGFGHPVPPGKATAPPHEGPEGGLAAPAPAEAAPPFGEATAPPSAERPPQGSEAMGESAQPGQISAQPSGNRLETPNWPMLIAGATAVFLIVAAIAALSIAAFAGNALVWSVLAVGLVGAAVYEAMPLVATTDGGTGTAIDLPSSLPEQEAQGEAAPDREDTPSTLDGEGKSPGEPAPVPSTTSVFGLFAALLLAGGLVVIALRYRKSRRDPPVEDESELHGMDPESNDVVSALAFLEAANAALHNLKKGEPHGSVLAQLAEHVAKGSGSRHVVIGDFGSTRDGKRSVTIRVIGEGDGKDGGEDSAGDFTLSPDTLQRLGGEELAAGRCVVLERGHASRPDESSQADAASIDTFLGLPLRGAKGVFGLLGLVNRAEGYIRHHAAFLAPVVLIAEAVLGSMGETDQNPKGEGEKHAEKAEALTESARRVGKISRLLRERYADGLGETGRLALDHLEDTAGQVLEHAGTTDGGDEITPEGYDSPEGTSEDRRSESQLRERRLERDRRPAHGTDTGDDVAQDSDGTAPGPGSWTRREGEASQRLTSFRLF